MVEISIYKPPKWCLLRENGRCYIWEAFIDSTEVYQMVFYEKECEKCLHRVRENDKLKPKK